MNLPDTDKDLLAKIEASADGVYIAWPDYGKMTTLLTAEPQPTKWDHRFMKIADEAASWTKDPKQGAGAVITKGKRIISVGFNGIPEGLVDDPEILNSPDKNKWICHGESNAIDFAQQPLDGATIYCSYYPCNECAKRIAQNRIYRVVTRRPVDDKPQHNWDVTTALFKKRGVQVVFID